MYNILTTKREVIYGVVVRLRCLIHHSFIYPTQLPGSGSRKQPLPTRKEGPYLGAVDTPRQRKDGVENRELWILKQEAWASAFITKSTHDLRVTPCPLGTQWPHL